MGSAILSLKDPNDFNTRKYLKIKYEVLYPKQRSIAIENFAVSKCKYDVTEIFNILSSSMNL